MNEDPKKEKHMRPFCLALFLLPFLVTIALAGSFGYGIDNIKSDPIQNRMYWGINKKGKGIFSVSDKIGTEVLNYVIFEPTSGKQKLIFPDNFNSIITCILFECAYDSLNHRMIMSNENGRGIYDQFDFYYGNREQNIVNNLCLPNRTPVDRILFVINPKGGSVAVREIWTCKKDGAELKKIDSFKEDDDFWHIDLLNKKIRIIIQKEKEAQIKEYEW
jgi:hypothetical protein